VSAADGAPGGEGGRAERPPRAATRSGAPTPGTGPARLVPKLARALLGFSVARGQARPAAAYGGGDAFGVDPVVVSPELLRAVIDVLVGDAQDFEIDARTAFGEELAHGRTEAAGDDVLFDCHEPRDTGGEREDPLLVERL